MAKKSATPHFNDMVAARGGKGLTAGNMYGNSAGIPSTPDFNRQTAGFQLPVRPKAPRGRKN